MRVIVDEIVCEGYGKCERVAADLFKIDEDGIAAVLVSDDLNPDQIERARAAVNLCPVNAIKLEENIPESNKR